MLDMFCKGERAGGGRGWGGGEYVYNAFENIHQLTNN